MGEEVTRPLDEEGLPPQDLRAEQATVGAMLVEPGAVDRVIATGLQASDFFRAAHATIYEAILHEHGRDRPMDLVTISNRLRNIGKLDEVGGGAYLNALIIDHTPTAAHAVRYAKIVQDKAKLRALLSLSADMREWIYAGDNEGSAVLGMTIAGLDRIEGQRPSAVMGQTVAELVEWRGGQLMRELEKPQSVRGARWEIEGLDRITGGLRPPCYAVLLGGTGTGKTAMLCQLTLESARTGMRCGYIDLETGRAAVHDKLVQQSSGVDLFKARTRHMNTETKARWLAAVADAEEHVRALPIRVEDPSDLPFGELRALIRRLQREHGAELVVVDYFQKIAPTPGLHTWSDMRSMSNQLQSLAQNLEIVIVVGSQVTRVEGVGWQVRGAKDVLHDADLGITLMKLLPIRSDRPDERERALAYVQSPRARILVPKARGGPVGSCDVLWSAPWQRFFDLREAGRWVTIDDEMRDAFSPDERARLMEGKQRAKVVTVPEQADESEVE